MKLGWDGVKNALGIVDDPNALDKTVEINKPDFDRLAFMIEQQQRQYDELNAKYSRLQNVVNKMKVIGVSDNELMTFDVIAQALRIDKDTLANFAENKPLEAMHLIMRNRETRMQTLTDMLASFQVSLTGKELWELCARVRGKYENKMDEIPRDMQQLLMALPKIEKHAEILTELCDVSTAAADGYTRIIDAADIKVGLAEQLEKTQLEYADEDFGSQTTPEDTTIDQEAPAAPAPTIEDQIRKAGVTGISASMPPTPTPSSVPKSNIQPAPRKKINPFNK